MSEYIRSTSGCGGIGALADSISAGNRAIGVSRAPRDPRLGWTPCGPLETQYKFHNDMSDIPLFDMGCHKRTSAHGTVLCCPTLPGRTKKGLWGLGTETAGSPSWGKYVAWGILGLLVLWAGHGAWKAWDRNF